jgi:hypothetical protein
VFQRDQSELWTSLMAGAATELRYAETPDLGDAGAGFFAWHGRCARTLLSLRDRVLQADVLHQVSWVPRLSTTVFSPRGSPLIFLNVQQCCAVNTELEPSPDALDESREVVNFGGAAPESTLGDEFRAQIGESLRCEPREVWVSTPHMLEVEGTIAEAIRSEQCRPFFALATTVVANGDLGPQ